jgi:NAD-dependent SIR2 family protein deacetylase
MLSRMSDEQPNREQHFPATPCGCTSCQRLFPYSDIADFWDEGETPVCPFCGLDTVLVSTPDMTVDARCLFAARKTYH